MAKRIRKSDDFYQESLIWMGYRFAIGISNCGSERCREKVYSELADAFHDNNMRLMRWG